LAGGVKQKVDRVIERLSHYFLVLSGILIVIMMFSATYGVVRRYAFNSPEPYSYEISTMFMVFSFVFAISAVERLGRHIRVDFVSGRLPERTQHIIINIIAPIMGLFFAFMLTWKGLDVSLFSLKIGEVSSSSWREPLFPIKLMVPIGYALLILVLLARIYKGFASLKGGTRKMTE
jgi:TRAP-type mannitol/chloroaromatic compound transport system permease small subunit